MREGRAAVRQHRREERGDKRQQAADRREERGDKRQQAADRREQTCAAVHSRT